jgi:hypothetical protein
MNTRDLLDHAVFTALSLGCLGLQLVFFWDVSGLRL